MLPVLLSLAVLGSAVQGGDYILEGFKKYLDAPEFRRVAVGPSGIYGLDNDGTVYNKFTRGDTPWAKEEDSHNFKEISSGGTEIWAVTVDDEVFMRKKGSDWKHVDGIHLAQVSVGYDDGVWGIHANGSIFRKDESGWEKVGGILKQISVGPSGVWAVDPYGDIFFRHGTYGGAAGKGLGWIPVAGRLKSIASGDNIVWGINYDGEVMYRSGVSENNNLGDLWIYIEGNFEQIDTFAGGVIAVDSNNAVYHNMATYSEDAVPVSIKANPLDQQICGEDNVDISEWKTVPYMVIVDAGKAGHYGCDKKGNIWKSVDGGLHWEKEPEYDAHFRYLGVGDRVLWAIDTVGHTFTKNPRDPSATWTRYIPPLNEVMMQVSVSEYDQVWATSLEQSIYRWVGTHWMRVFGRLKVAAVGPSGVWGITHNDDIYYRIGTRGIESAVGSGWKLIQGKSKFIASGHNIVFSINSVDNVFRRVGISDANPAGTHWRNVEGKLQQIDVYKNELWGHDVNHKVWSLTFQCEQA